MLEVGNELHGFAVKSTEELPEIDGHAIVMDHPESGAKLLFLQNDDENKAFSIAFRTPPADDTGVFHILEHSVLCGSEKFPVREPFVNLLRTSMQTFLNAMTFPDKTMYPVASTNEQDLLNLMDVYLDAVLHPKLHTNKHIFEQEGWHYELNNAAAQAGNEAVDAAPEADGTFGLSNRELVYNGVVFNEMKGVLAEPDSVLYHAMNRALFPNTCYAFESGGHPRAIPQLTYESYCDTHARHYRLDNSYIVLYGDLDIDRILAFLNDNYLGKAAQDSVATQVPQGEGSLLPPKPIGKIVPVTSFDNVVEMPTSPENAMVGLGYVIGESHDFERVLAADILNDALMGGNEAPLKRAVLDAQLGGDCTAFLIDSQEQPVALFLLKNAKPDVAGQFRELVEGEVRKLVEDGIPRDVLEASLAQMSFALRERDRGIADGVVLAMNALSGWLYNDDDATTYLHYEDPLAHLRAGLENRYFEDVLSALVLDSKHAALVDLQPHAQAGAGLEEAELAAKQASFAPEDYATIEAEVEALRAWQESEDSPEALATLPQLHLSDIGPAKPEQGPVISENTPVPCLYHNLSSRHINYLYYYFNLEHLTWEDMPYVSLLIMLLGNLDTEAHTAAELDVYTRQHLGRMNFMSDMHADHNDRSKIALHFVVSASALAEECENLAALPAEVWSTTRFDDSGRIRDMLVQRRIALEESFLSEGHVRAMNRASSYLFKSALLTEYMAGVDFYYFLKELIEHFDERFDALRERLESLLARIFAQENCTLSFTGSPDEMEAFWKHWDTSVAPALGTLNGAPSALEIPEPTNKREAFVIPSDVCFVSKAADFGELDYDGTWTVLGRVLGFDYLWKEVRTMGGAYGCGFRSGKNGHGRFFSFRDPQLDDTLARFDAAQEWLANFDPNPDEMEGYIVSSVATHDAPQKARLIARRQDAEYFANRPNAWREYLRETLLAVTPEALRGLSDNLSRMVQSDAVCVFGSADIINAAQEDLNSVALFEEQPDSGQVEYYLTVSTPDYIQSASIQGNTLEINARFARGETEETTQFSQVADSFEYLSLQLVDETYYYGTGGTGGPYVYTKEDAESFFSNYSGLAVMLKTQNGIVLEVRFMS